MSFNRQGLVFCLSTLIVFFLMETASAKPTKILADTLFLKAMGITPLASDEELHLSVAEVSEYQASTLSHSAHRFGKCGGFEQLPDSYDANENFEFLRFQKSQAQAFQFLSETIPHIPKQAAIESAVHQVSEDNLRSTVQWLSQFPSRYHKGPNNNQPVEELAQRARQMLQGLKYPYVVETISHTKTPQKSVHVRLQGKERPHEVVVLGGHLDSIANWGFGRAPGADDNASGSSNLLEALRIVSLQEQPSRSIDFFWYAGEEIGLVGSSEIAQTYGQNKIEVVGVLQLDMTLFPGEGELIVGDMTDFTNPWLRGYARALNDHYIGAQWREDQCGYGCSDHASWHRQGYPTIMPFEATFQSMNQNIHTADDVVSPQLNFKHSASFTKLAVAFALDLSNSTLKPTF
ncbi:MAG: hypothetical protein RJB66_100 [Pseudomonadota bacterium]|jgi:leucyl aminopeptidase